MHMIQNMILNKVDMDEHFLHFSLFIGINNVENPPQWLLYHSPVTTNQCWIQSTKQVFFIIHRWQAKTNKKLSYTLQKDKEISP